MNFLKVKAKNLSQEVMGGVSVVSKAPASRGKKTRVSAKKKTVGSIKKKGAVKKAPVKKKGAAVKPQATKAKKKAEAPKYSKAWFKEQKKNIDLSTWTETELVLLRRRSTRIFQKKQVPENLVMRVLEAGRFAPTAGNNMHWRYTVVRDPKMLKEMEDDAYKSVGTMGKYLDYWKRPYLKPMVKVLQYKFPNELHPIPHGVIKLVSEVSFKAFWDAPTLILLFKDVRGIGCPDLDLGILGQNMIIAAHSMGLGTCWVGLAKALAMYPKWKKTFEIAYPFQLAQAICLGYPVGEADGFAARDTHAIDWFDENGKKVVY